MIYFSFIYLFLSTVAISFYYIFYFQSMAGACGRSNRSQSKAMIFSLGVNIKKVK